jgi:putative DNA primase/helicase
MAEQAQERPEELGSRAGSSTAREAAKAARRQALNTATRRATEPTEPRRRTDQDEVFEMVAVKQPASDLGNARRFVSRYGHEFCFVHDLGIWLWWNGRYWERDATGEVHRCAKETVDWLGRQAWELADGERKAELVKHALKSGSARSLSAMVTVASTEREIAVTATQLDADPWSLTVANGEINLRTGELRKHDPAVLATRMSPAHFIPGEGAPRFRQFLDEVFDGDDELIGFVRRFFGSCLTGDVSGQMCLFALGSGANGKTTLLNEIRHVLGGYATNLDPAILTTGQHDQHPTAMMDLRGARLATTIETEQGRPLAEARLKMLTGGDPITARRMRQDFETFPPSHKLVIVGNHLPPVHGTDHAIWRRIAIVPFGVRFPPERQDPHLAEKLRRESSGILAWMVEGCLEWQSCGGLNVPRPVVEATRAYRVSEDRVGRFLQENTTAGPDLWVPSKQLRDAYTQWSVDSGEEALTTKALALELVARGFTSEQRGRLRTRGWRGLGLTSDRPPEEG